MAEAILGEAGRAPDFEDELGYDPFEFIEGDDDEDWDDGDGSLLPSALPRESRAPRRAAAVYSPERAGSVGQALRDLVTVNASRRTILLSVVDWARDGVRADDLFRRIEGLHKDNRSVYEPVSYCRMLERAGALTLEFVEDGSEGEGGSSEGSEGTGGSSEGPEGEGSEGARGGAQDFPSVVDGEPSYEEVSYLPVAEKERHPVWRSTEEGLAAYEELVRGDEWRQKVLGKDARYAEVYLAVMRKLAEGGCKKAGLASLAESFEVTKQPRKLGNYFIDVLEATCAIHWSDALWRLTDLGERLLSELEEFCAQRAKASSVSQEGEHGNGQR